MRRFLFPILVLATFLFGALVSLAWQTRGTGKSLISFFIVRVRCDTAMENCRARMRSEARLLFLFGDDRGGNSIYRQLALAGDPKSAFQIGWHQEEAYRKVVGRSLAASTPIAEEAQYPIGKLPDGAAFEVLVDRYAAPKTASEQTEAHRALAFLWYGRAAQAGFGPAMNNLASMYQFGITGKVDKGRARSWYVAAYDAGTPVAALNLARLRTIGYDDHRLDCMEQSGNWLPLVIIPPPQYLHEDVIQHTRFRGLPSDRTIVVLIETLMKGIPTSTAAEQATLKSALEVIASSVSLAKSSGSSGWPVYDDESPEEQKKVPTFSGLPVNTGTSGNCGSIPPDPRTIRAGDLALQRLMMSSEPDQK